jgi:hypothetical protein
MPTDFSFSLTPSSSGPAERLVDSLVHRRADLGDTEEVAEADRCAALAVVTSPCTLTPNWAVAASSSGASPWRH